MSKVPADRVRPGAWSVFPLVSVVTRRSVPESISIPCHGARLAGVAGIVNVDGGIACAVLLKYYY
jgi:hypothetical protein